MQLKSNPMALFRSSSLLLFTFLLLSFSYVCTRAEPSIEEKEALLDFISQTPHKHKYQWNSSEPVCNWAGVGCDPNASYVSSLRIPGAGLVGHIPPGTIGRLTRLRVLSLRSNRLSGKLPHDFSNLRYLHRIYLQNNSFSGEFPPSLTRLSWLIRVDISDNNFTGKLPPSLGKMTHLTGLFLENNGFSGNLPNMNLSRLRDFNVSNNNLNGSIPKSLQQFLASSFAGNDGLCDGPMVPCNPSPPPPSPSAAPPPPPSRSPPPSASAAGKLSSGAIAATFFAGAAVLLL